MATLGEPRTRRLARLTPASRPVAAFSSVGVQDNGSKMNTENAFSLDWQWKRVSGLMRAEIGEAAYRSWLKPMVLRGETGGLVTMAVPTRFMRDWVIAHYADRLRALWGGENPAVRGIDIVVQADRVASSRNEVPMMC